MLTKKDLPQIKKIFLIILFVLIIINAHPIFLTYDIVNLTWPYLHVLGLDVFMKPFTSDMVFMYDAQLKKTLYRYNFDVIYHTAAGDMPLKVRDLSFHRWRIPFTWFGIAAMNGEDLHPYIQTLCIELRRSYGVGSGFTIRSEATKDITDKYGMNQNISCDDNE